MNPTEELRHEHEVIKRVLAVLDKAAARAEKGQALPPDFFPRVVDIVRNFADRCHHGKEEETLFPLMEQRGVPRQGGPIGVMLLEHERGRAHVRAMDEAGKRLAAGGKDALKAGIENARGYVELLTQHINKEDHVLFPMADRVLTPADQQDLAEKFERIEQERLGPGKHEEYVGMVEALEREVAG